MRDRVDRHRQATLTSCGADLRALAEFYPAFLRGFSVQAADGVPRDILLAPLSHALLPLKSALSAKADDS